MFLYNLVFALALLFISIFIKKMFLYLTLIPAWLGVIVLSRPYEGAAYIQSSAGIVIIYAIAQVFRIRRGSEI